MTDDFKKALNEYHYCGMNIDEKQGFKMGADFAYEWCQKKLHIMSEQLKNAKADREEAIFESDERLKELNLLRAEAEALASALDWIQAGVSGMFNDDDNNSQCVFDRADHALQRWRKFRGEE